MDTLTRNAVRDSLDADERIEHTAALMDLIGQLSQKLGEILHTVAGMNEENADPVTAVWIAQLLGSSKQFSDTGSQAALLLSQAQDRAVQLARANGASWSAIGNALDEDGRNLLKRYRRKEES